MSGVKLITCCSLCVLTMLCGAGLVRADWTYPYADDFTTDKAEFEAYYHSIFWSKEGVLPSEPYLYYTEIDRNRGLAFADNSKGQKAELRYRFPLTPAPAARAIKGSLTLDVSFPAEISQFPPGRLEYQTSPDGTTGWSAAQVLDEGHHDIPLTSAGTACYIRFSGARVVIDNLVVALNSKPVTIRVGAQGFATIQAAIDAAGDGDVIEVDKGTYRGPGNRDIDFRGKAITVRGAASARETIIDCEGVAARAEGGHRGFYFHRLEGPDSVLSDLTIRGGRVFGSQVPPDPLRSPSPAHPIGGGIYCELSGPTIANCIIEDCGAEIGGGIGGVEATPMIEDCVIEECIAGGLGAATSGGRGAAIGLIGNSNATITNCIIRANAGYRNGYGAGLYFQQSTATVAGCSISENLAEGVRGGGAYCGGAATDVTFRNCIFSRNQAIAGGSLCVEGAGISPRSRVSVVNCTIAQNGLLTGAPTGAAGGIQSSGADVVVTSSILWANTGKALVITGSMLADAVTYSDIQGGYSGPGNISADPLFASLVTDSEDYHLRSKYGRYDPTSGRSVSDKDQSPCIDAGDPSASVGEEPPPNGNCIDMGAYGGTKQASQSPERFTYHVNNRDGGSDWNPGTPERPFATVQKAINVARDGDTVLVWPGTYKEDLDFKGKAITVRSARDAAVLTAAESYAVTFDMAERGGSVLANFVISGCPYAGIFCSGASPTLRNLTIVGNTSGIVAYDGSDPNITNCILWSNSASDVWDCKPRFSNIEDNVADTKLGNMRRDPMFADPQRSDYHLKSSAGHWDPWAQAWVADRDTSPCIDAGNPRDDFRWEPTPNGGRIDMGAHGGTPYASKSLR